MNICRVIFLDEAAVGSIVPSAHACRVLLPSFGIRSLAEAYHVSTKQNPAHMTGCLVTRFHLTFWPRNIAFGTAFGTAFALHPQSPAKMPTFRGIEVCIVTESESRRLPEFPHPDGSSVRLLAPGEVPPSPCSSIFSETDPTRRQKVNPMISVYVPSLPGTSSTMLWRMTTDSL